MSGAGRATSSLRSSKPTPTSKGSSSRPHVAAAAQPRLADAGLAHRCEVVAGDFFEALPSGGDVYILKNVIDSFEDDRTVRLLQHCHRAMAPQGKLLVVGQVIRPGNDPAVSKLLDLALLVQVGGPVRTEAELHRLFAGTLSADAHHPHPGGDGRQHHRGGAERARLTAVPRQDILALGAEVSWPYPVVRIL